MRQFAGASEVAKCIQVVGQGVSVRLSDDDAFQVVDRDRDGQYCAKHYWKGEYDTKSATFPDGRPRRYVRLVGNRLTAQD
jgi:hypothetical protein